jgi:hypothetical protein
MTDPYEYEDWLDVLYEQLPRDLRHRLTIAIECDESDKSRIAVFTRCDGRSWRFPVQDDGFISQDAIVELCVVVV